MVKPSGKECFFGDNELIVSKTDIHGKITYANDVFIKIAGYTEAELLGKPHSIIRHPEMPRAVFKLLWDTIQSGSEIFAYVMNMAKNGDHYWVFAHATPSFDGQGNIVGYHSNRRTPDRQAVNKIIPIYQTLCKIEQSNPDPRIGLQNSFKAMVDLLQSNKVQYDQFVFSL